MPPPDSTATARRNRQLRRSFAMVMALLFAAPTVAEPIAPERLYVVDGDTLRVDHGNPVRLVGYNAPEIRNHAECTAERDKGKEATRRLRELVAGGGLDLRYVTCSCPPGQQGTSSCNYGRRCAILRARGKDVGEVLIAEGLAVPFRCGASRCPAGQGPGASSRVDP